MASSIFVLWNPLVGTKILPLFAQVGDFFFREQFVHSSLQLAQVAVDGGLRGAQLGGDLADGALHIKDARMVHHQSLVSYQTACTVSFSLCGIITVDSPYLPELQWKN